MRCPSYLDHFFHHLMLAGASLPQTSLAKTSLFSMKILNQELHFIRGRPEEGKQPSVTLKTSHRLT